jgi:molybdopterin adenylyltransferase
MSEHTHSDEAPRDRRYTAWVITVSDKASRGEREDAGGPAVVSFLEENGFDVVGTSLVPDDQARIAVELIRAAEGAGVDLCVTTGGTGFSPRDVTPEATLSVVERLAPGVVEHIRQKSFEKTPHAILSRAVCGIRRQTVILNLPGSPRGAVESLAFVLDPLKHGIDVLKGVIGEHA